MKILLVRVYSIHNAGDHAILRATLRLVERAFPGAQVTVAIQDPASAHALPGKEHFVGGLLSWIARIDAKGQMHVRRLQWICYTLLVVLSVACYRWFRRRCILLRDPQKRRLLQAYFKADLVLASGGGYLYDPRKCSWWFIGVVMELALAIWLDKPLILLPQSIGPLPGGEQRWLVRWLIQRAKLALIRDEYSYKLLEAIGVKGAIMRFPDLAFAQRSAALEEAWDWLEHQGCTLETQHLRIGLTVLNWSALHATFTNRQQTAYERALVDFCDTLIDQGAQIICLPQSCGPRAADDDRLIALRIRAQLMQPKGFIVLMEQPLPEVLQAVCQEFDFMISTRMHSAIFAFNVYVPTLVINYMRKSRGVLRWLRWDRWCTEIRTVESRQLLAKFNQLQAEHETLRLELCQHVETLQLLAESLPALLQSVWRSSQCKDIRWSI